MEIKYNTAILAVKKGFDRPCIAWYFSKDKTPRINKSMEFPFTGLNWNRKGLKHAGRVSAPTQTKLRKWLREKHAIHIKYDFLTMSEEHSMIVVQHRLSYDMGVSSIYEEILEIALQEALKLL